MNQNELKIKFKFNIFAFVLATLATLFFPQILNLKGNELVFANSIFSVFVWILSFYALKLSLQTIDLHDKRGFVIAGVLSFLFTLAMLFGARLDDVENVDFTRPLFWLSLPVITCFFTILVRKFWNFLGSMEEKKERLLLQTVGLKLPKIDEKYNCVLIFAIMILCWLPVFLAVYPGFFVYDAQDEFLQVASRNFTTHHPILHVLLLGGVICAVHKVTDSYNLGIACYIIMQMLFVAGGLTYLLYYLQKKQVAKWIRVCSLIYLSLFPVIVMFTLCSAKDTIFTIALLLLVLAMLEMGIDEKTFFAKKSWQIFFVISAMTMMLFRKNGVYAFLVMIPILLVFHKKVRKKLLILLLVSVIGYFVVNAGLNTVFHAENSENQEILTVPIQQVARTYKFCPEVFSQEDVDILHEVLPEDALLLYNARLSDPVKIHFDNQAFSKDKSRYAALWLRIGLKKPLSYINAWLMTSYGFWYPDTVINVYSGNSVFTFTYQDSSYFGYEVEEPGYRDSKIPWLDEMYRKMSLEIEQEKIPVFSMLFSPGCLFWCFAFVFSYVFYRRKYHILMPYCMILLVWLTVILGPTYLPRYVLIFWYALPLFAAVMFEEERFVVKSGA